MIHVGLFSSCGFIKFPYTNNVRISLRIRDKIDLEKGYNLYKPSMKYYMNQMLQNLLRTSLYLHGCLLRKSTSPVFFKKIKNREFRCCCT